MRRQALVFSVLLAGCEVDVAGLPPIDGYEAWHRFATSGPLPGHGDSVRIFYVNDVARSYPHAGRYPIGSVIVKEIHEDAGHGRPGALRYVAIMRKVGEDADVELPVEGGWVFTRRTSRDGPERRGVTCWVTCHKAAPWDGAWFDYGE